MAKFNSPIIKSDTDWALTREANPMRGYHDHERTIVFVDETPHQTQVDTCEAIITPYRGSGPVWAYYKDQGNNSWYLRQGYDSGD